jgi:hypothetical protein
MAAIWERIGVTVKGDIWMFVQQCPFSPVIQSLAEEQGNEFTHFNVFDL